MFYQHSTISFLNMLKALTKQTHFVEFLFSAALFAMNMLAQGTSTNISTFTTVTTYTARPLMLFGTNARQASIYRSTATNNEAVTFPSAGAYWEASVSVAGTTNGLPTTYYPAGVLPAANWNLVHPIIAATSRPSYDGTEAVAWTNQGALSPPTTTPSSIGALLRDSYRAAQISNPVVTSPLLPAQDWQPNTAYIQGQVVQNGGAEYVCDFAGTSASSGGPSGNTVHTIADGTVSWYYYGLVKTTKTTNRVPVVTSQALPCVAGLTKYLTFNSSPSIFTVSSGVPYIRNNLNTYVQGVTISATQPGSAGGHSGNNSSMISFLTDAPKICLDAGGHDGVRLLINDVYVRPGVYVTPYAAGHYHIVLDMTTMDKAVRKISITGKQNFVFNGIAIDSISTAWAVNQKKLRMMCLGNSILAGGNNSVVQPYENPCGLTANLLGISDVWNLGIGGTDYLAQGPGNNYFNYGQHLFDVTNNSPDIVVFMLGGINDSQPAAALAAAAVSDVTLLRAYSKTLPIIVTGEWPGSSGPSIAIKTNETAILGALAALNDPALFLIPVSTASTPWISGTGTVTAPNGTGNADMYVSGDGSHPTVAASYFLANKLLSAIVPLLSRIN